MPRPPERYPDISTRAPVALASLRSNAGFGVGYQSVWNEADTLSMFLRTMFLTKRNAMIAAMTTNTTITMYSSIV